MFTKSILTQLRNILFTTITLFLSNGFTYSQDQQYVFSQDALLTRQDSLEGPYLGFLDNDQLSSGIYVLKAGADDGQSPHQLDEIYYVLEGTASIKIEDQIRKIKSGDIIFVPAMAKHQFVDILEDLKLLVFFSKQKIKEK